MDKRFRAFSFVDRIVSIQPGVRIAGSYAIPSGIECFPASLVAEAVGQLAAWASMAACDFERRPVAGIAGSIELIGRVQPGQNLELAVELESLDADAVAYGGIAHADGNPVIRLQNCVGPMVLQEEFDDAQAIGDRFKLLCGAGVAPGGFAGMPALSLDRTGGEFGRCARATLQVPADAPLFADHFPRRPVFPGSLLMHVNLELAAALAAEVSLRSNAVSWALRKVSNIKLRAFIPPGEHLQLEARLNNCDGDIASIDVETRTGKRVVGGARVLLEPEATR